MKLKGSNFLNNVRLTWDNIMKINLTKFKEYLISWHYWQVNLIVFSIKYNNNDHEKLWNVNSAVEVVYDV